MFAILYISNYCRVIYNNQQIHSNVTNRPSYQTTTITQINSEQYVTFIMSTNQYTSNWSLYDKTNLQITITYIEWHYIFVVDHFSLEQYNTFLKTFFKKFNLCNFRPAYEEINSRERSAQEYEALSHSTKY